MWWQPSCGSCEVIPFMHLPDFLSQICWKSPEETTNGYVQPGVVGVWVFGQWVVGMLHQEAREADPVFGPILAYSDEPMFPHV